MPTTANGTVYTSTTVTIPGLGRCRYTVGDAFRELPNRPTALYAHGANGGVGSMSGGPSWVPFVHPWMDRGGVIIEGEGGTVDASGTTFNHWGNQMNRDAYMAYFAYVAGIVDIGALFAIGSSMGGLITKWLATRSEIAHRINGLISFAAVGTMFHGNLDPVPTDTPTTINQRTGRYFGTSILNAYGVTSYADLEVAAADHAPELWPASVWSGKRILELYADNDIAVPWSPRGSSHLRTIRSGQPAADIAQGHTGLAVGHDLSTGAGVNWTQVFDFIDASIPTDPPEPPEVTVYVAGNAYLSRGGALYPIVFA